ncbi:MAG: hypothetical protein GX895_00960 [Clostridiales bacterium]|uniref:hypothetical protein n=1 Tax=Clostridium sp. N3C TaxID=1776758 RepID=UPI00092DF880|nr:hypothetical protein [Clostridium sp. N3C]NLZ47354.1 hypothetical protein [Clostridiales bacterium]SCN21367.1 hypothetical protein N3C_0144 [Clostridium sp. N3C]
MVISKIIKVHEDNIDSVIDKLKEIKRGKIKFIFYDEDIYIDRIYIPPVKKAWMDNLISNNLIYNFEDIRKLAFSYEIISKKNSKYKIILYCINSKKNILYKSIKDKHKIVGVYLIQHCYHYYVKENLKVKDYILVFDSKKYTYIIYSKQGFLQNSLLYNRDEVEISVVVDSINKILSDHCLTKEGKILPIIMLNYEKTDLLMELLNDYCFKNMGTVNENKIIRKYVGVF